MIALGPRTGAAGHAICRPWYWSTILLKKHGMVKVVIKVSLFNSVRACEIH